jgi:hypothetical protein
VAASRLGRADRPDLGDVAPRLRSLHTTPRRRDTGAVSVHQCPYCELRFTTRNEVEDHVATDHPGDVDDDSFPASDDDS